MVAVGGGGFEVGDEKVDVGLIGVPAGHETVLTRFEEIVEKPTLVEEGLGFVGPKLDEDGVGLAGLEDFDVV